MTPAELDFLTERKRAYQLMFSSPAGQSVLKDLTRYCRAKMTTFSSSAERHERSWVLEGRRQVYLRIQQHLELDAKQLYKLYEDIGDYDG